MYRTHHNGDLRLSHLNQTVTLIGWVAKKRNLGSLLFIDLRDRSGIVQVFAKQDEVSIPDIRNEYLIQVTGVVSRKEVANPNLPTGEVEVLAQTIKVINKANATPMIVADETDALEEVRLKYRYLDLRRPSMQNKLIIRSKIVKAVHEYLDNHEFIEIETPILTKSTPGGARDFLVPSRIHPGAFYALPQSPQIYKQLLMIGGMERYYQIARCFRDEDLRADRQPDFTQIDIEASFLEQDEFLALMEGLLKKIFKDVKNYDIQLPLRRLSYDDAMNTYGSDKPDTRFGLTIQDIKQIFNHSQASLLTESAFVKAIVVPNVAEATSRKINDELNLIARKYNLKAVAILKNEATGLSGSLLKLMDESEKAALVKALHLSINDIVIIANGEKNRDVCFCLGAIRNHYAKKLELIKPNTYDLLWMTHFPLFSKDEKTGNYVAEHHAFTRPCDEDLHYLDTDPSKAYAQAYDIVINGYEAGGGSMRIFDHDTQYKIFQVMGMSEEDIQAKFGFFVDAFNFGTPPHGGIAFGLDRLAMILSGTDNIRDVIAFPKNLAAVCPMSDEPTPVDPKQLEELSIMIKIATEQGE